MPPDSDEHTAVIQLTREDELFEGLPAGSPASPGLVRSDWDHVGATLGEPGVIRLLRILNGDPRKTKLLITIPPTPEPASAARHADELAARFRAWCEAHSKAHRDLARQHRRAGARLLLVCSGLLALTLLASTALLHETPFGPPGPFRTLLSEAVVIAGWVAMWRPLELLIFDPIRPLREARLLERLSEVAVRHRGSGALEGCQ